MIEEESKEKQSLWKNHDYLRLWFGQTVSIFGSRASGIVLPLLILDITRSPAQAEFVGAFTVVPYVVLSLFAGTLVDYVGTYYQRLPKRERLFLLS